MNALQPIFLSQASVYLMISPACYVNNDKGLTEIIHKFQYSDILPIFPFTIATVSPILCFVLLYTPKVPVAFL